MKTTPWNMTVGRVFLSALLLLCPTLKAATDSWTGATNSNFSSSNWTVDNPPQTNDALIFGSGTGAGGKTLTDNYFTSGSSVAGITFASGAVAFIINPGTVGTNGFTLTGGITNSSTSLEKINDLIVVSGTQTMTTTAGGGNITLGGAISGAGAGITKAGSGTLTLSGSVSYTGNTAISAGSLVIQGQYSLGMTGTLTAPNSAGGFSTQGGGVFSMQSNGVENGYFQNFGTFQYSSGTFNGTLENDGTVTLNGAFSAGSGIIVNSVISVGTGNSAYAGGTGLDNESEIDLSSGTVGGVSTLNNGLISGYGTINGANFTNYGQVTQSGGNITLAATGTNTNNGNVGLASGYQLRLSGSNLSNAGTINLNGAIVTGSAALVNNSGGSINGYGSIQTTFSNNRGGTVSLTGGGLAITQAFTNAGTIQLGALTANLTGGAITNNASIQGFGSIGNDISNAGTIQPSGGTLILNGNVSNTSAGLISSGSGSEVLINSGLATNNGIISLTGGIFDNGGNAMNNANQISGYGTLRVGTGTNRLTNNGSITFTSGSTTVNGDITNAVGETISVSYYPATFTGNIINNGIFQATSAIVSFTGTFSNNGAYLSDPSVQNFASLAIGVNGSLVGGAGDVYKVTGNVTNNSTQAGAFNISGAKLTLAGTVNHQFTWSGADLGSTAAGYENNFAIGTLELQAGGSLTIEGESGTGAAGVGIYASVLQLDGGLAQIASITGNGADIYYDPTQAGNAYLGDQTYALQGGGEITAAIPEPGTVSLLTLGMIVGMGLLGRRKKH